MCASVCQRFNKIESLWRSTVDFYCKYNERFMMWLCQFQTQIMWTKDAAQKKKITAKSYYYNSNAEQKRTNQQCPLRVFPFHLKMNSGVARRIFMFFPCLDGVMFWLVDIIFKFIQYRLIAHTFGSKMQSSFSLGFHLVNGFALVWVQLVSELSSHTHEDRHIDTYIHMKQMWNIPIVYKIPRNATFGMQ